MDCDTNDHPGATCWQTGAVEVSQASGHGARRRRCRRESREADCAKQLRSEAAFAVLSLTQHPKPLLFRACHIWQGFGLKTKANPV